MTPRFALFSNRGSIKEKGRFPTGPLRVLALALSCILVPVLGCADENDFCNARAAMVEHQIRNRGIMDTRVLDAMATVPRHRFVPPDRRGQAYDDHPLPIGEGQTVSQPYVVALMTELLSPKSNDRVLEIGTGSGYQAAVLAHIVKEVYTIEIVAPLYEKTTALLKEMGYANIFTRLGDGYQGWKEACPFDGILITAAVDRIPPALAQQLKDGGRLVLPLGHPGGVQKLVRVTKKGDTLRTEPITDVLFVPMTGEALKQSP